MNWQKSFFIFARYPVKLSGLLPVLKKIRVSFSVKIGHLTA